MFLCWFLNPHHLSLFPCSNHHLLTTFHYSGLTFVARVYKYIWPYLTFSYRSLTLIFYSEHCFLPFQSLCFPPLMASNFLSRLYVSPEIHNGKWVALCNLQNVHFSSPGHPLFVTEIPGKKKLIIRNLLGEYRIGTEWGR